MEKSPAAQIDRKSSIETEPLTLNISQIQFAREAALSVMNTKSIEEALSIFTKGSEPVVSVARQKEEDMEADLGEEVACFATQMRLPRSRDVVTAPF